MTTDTTNQGASNDTASTSSTDSNAEQSVQKPVIPSATTPVVKASAQPAPVASPVVVESDVTLCIVCGCHDPVVAFEHNGHTWYECRNCKALAVSCAKDVLSGIIATAASTTKQGDTFHLDTHDIDMRDDRSFWVLIEHTPMSGDIIYTREGIIYAMQEAGFQYLREEEGVLQFERIA